MKIFSKYFIFGFVAVIFGLCSALPAFALDGDDEIKPDNPEERIADKATTAESAKVEAKFPQEAKEIRDAIALHVQNANSKNLDAYMADFIAERIKYPELERNYAARAMGLMDLKLDVKAVEFSQLTRTSATVHTRQISTYIDETGQKRMDDAIISYRWLKDAKDGVWRVAFTERRRFQAAQ